MSSKAVAWTLLAAIAVAAVLLFNYWAAYQLLSTLVYSGIVLALCGLANLILPFKFLGIRKRAVGAFVLVGGVVLTFAALLWPASTIRVAHHQALLDDAMPEYQFFEKHSARVHARPEQVMQAVRQSTFGDLSSLVTLMTIRGVVLRAPFHKSGDFLDKRVLDAFSSSGYLTGNGNREVVMCGGGNVRAKRGLGVRTLQEFSDYREQGAVKMAFNFSAEDAGNGWSTVSTETRVLATDDLTRRGMGRYWRLIVPGSGLLRRQWLDGIKRRAESMSNQQT